MGGRRGEIFCYTEGYDPLYLYTNNCPLRNYSPPLTPGENLRRKASGYNEFHVEDVLCPYVCVACHGQTFLPFCWLK